MKNPWVVLASIWAVCFVSFACFADECDQEFNQIKYKLAEANDCLRKHDNACEETHNIELFSQLHLKNKGVNSWVVQQTSPDNKAILCQTACEVGNPPNRAKYTCNWWYAGGKAQLTDMWLLKPE